MLSERRTRATTPVLSSAPYGATRERARRDNGLLNELKDAEPIPADTDYASDDLIGSL